MHGRLRPAALTLRMTFVFKILPAAAWTSREGCVPWAPIDRADGFVHLSAADQVRGTAEAHFSDQTDLLLLRLDAAIVPGLKWEASRAGALFPHAYADIPLTSVVDVHRFVFDEPGVFRYPSDC
ncbi:MAG: DUF952 domain-containing protein [Myxococcota bacterium]